MTTPSQGGGKPQVKASGPAKGSGSAKGIGQAIIVAGVLVALSILFGGGPYRMVGAGDGITYRVNTWTGSVTFCSFQGCFPARER